MSMRPVLPFLIASGLVCFPLWESYADLPPRPALRLLPKQLEVDGVQGLWFPKNQSEQITLHLQHIPKLEAIIEEQDGLIAVLEDQVETASASAATNEEIARLERERGDDYKSLLDKEMSWKKSPLLWVGVGAGAATIIIGSVLVLVKLLQTQTVNVVK